ncbi:MAG: type II toxin-antitoxin system RatA family toxin, partial [Lamprobacter sp.]|uniref:type II toxin-antitoxin system RatA family toxin n=1 Tax=Lamprobacter sp. TaxID=3100796 RepID=UPI002B256BAA
MPAINRSALLPYTPRQLFDLVNDVEAYPQYMEGCVGAEVLHADECSMEARLDLARAGFAQSFITLNTLSAPESIALQLKDGPFERFAGCWRFQALGDAACKISLQLEFSVGSSLVGAAAGRLFDRVSN